MRVVLPSHLYRNIMSLLITANGEPAAPQDVLKQLRGFDPALSLKWLPLMQEWALTLDWKPSDVRRQHVKEGRLSGEATFDVIGYLPDDCSPEFALSYVERNAKRVTPGDGAKLADEAQAETEAAQTAALDKASENVLDDINSIAGRRLTGGIASFGGIDTKKSPKKKGR